MGLTKIIDDAYLVPLGTANAVLLDGVSELALVDAGLSGKVSVVLDAIRQMNSLIIIPTISAARLRSSGTQVWPPTCTRSTRLSQKPAALSAPCAQSPA